MYLPMLLCRLYKIEQIHLKVFFLHFFKWIEKYLSSKKKISLGKVLMCAYGAIVQCPATPLLLFSLLYCWGLLLVIVRREELSALLCLEASLLALLVNNFCKQCDNCAFARYCWFDGHTILQQLLLLLQLH